MLNTEVVIKGKIMTITVNLDKIGAATKGNPEGLSKTGKTVIIATTSGNARIAANGAGEVFVGLNVYKYPKAK